ncbi:hypothetical protein C5B85_17865 [Pseudoclavibacter sp. AY1F1]|nr:hypothetical protein C5B85_17865 [Pseudoclavibacter sp. AY1F1]
MPVIALAAATPAFAASAVCTGAVVPFTTPGSFTAVEVPTGTRAFTYVVRGAGGGRGSSSGSSTIPGSQGGIATGRVVFGSALTAPLSLRVYVGQGGQLGSNVTGTVALGGTGYGAGGSSTPTRPAQSNQATIYTGGGGGASAITLASGVPLVVAGGGGGGGISEFITNSTKQQAVLSAPFQGLQYGTASAIASPNGRGSGMAGINETVTTFSVSPGLAPTGALAGVGGIAGGAQTYSTLPSPTANPTTGWSQVSSVSGSIGGSFGTTIGGNGGNGAAVLGAISGTRNLSASAGGGGGGYAGGGGGGIARGRFGAQTSTSAAVSTGAAGSSFVATTAVTSGTVSARVNTNVYTTSTLNPDVPNLRGHAGQVEIRYCR